MTRTINHALAAFAALALTYASIASTISVPADRSIVVSEIA